MGIIQFNQILLMEEHISRKVILAFGGMEMIGSDIQKGSTAGFAHIQKDVFCLHTISELKWTLAWGQGDWRDAGNALGVKSIKK